MIRQAQTQQNVINLDGPEGNAFYLIGFTAKVLQQRGIGYDPAQLLELKSYKELLKAIDGLIGDMVIFETSNPEILEF